MSFDCARRGVLHVIVAGILLPLSDQQPCVIVALESSGMKSSSNAASLMWSETRAKTPLVQTMICFSLDADVTKYRKLWSFHRANPWTGSSMSQSCCNTRYNSAR